jgi:hypothetical protein
MIFITRFRNLVSQLNLEGEIYKSGFGSNKIKAVPFIFSEFH